MMEDEEDDVLQELKTKIEEYFQNKKAIEKKEDLDSFLEAIDLLEVWNTDEEKEVFWQSLIKYSKNGIIDYNAAINGIKDLMNQEEEQESQETILTHLSRRASVRDPQKGKVSYSKLKQIALDEYGCVDDDTLFQLKKIFSLLNVNKDNTLIKLSKIEEICSENKFIKITPEEIWKYLSFLSYDNNEGKTYRPMHLHFTVFTDILNFINEKIPDDDVEEKEKDDNNELDEDTDEDEPLDIIEKIINNTDSIQGESKAFNDIIKSLNILAGDMVEKAQNILNGNDNTLDDVIFVKDLMMKKISDLNKHNKIIERQQKSNNGKMEKITFYINKLKNDLQTLEEDYKALSDKYENHQKNINTNDDEVERLFGENLILYQDKEAKEKEIKKKKKKKKEIDDKYNKLFTELENSLNKNKEMQKEISDIKIKSLKYKTDYEDTLEKLISLEKIYNQELLKNEEKKSKEEEDLNKTEDILELFAKKQGIENPSLAFKRKSQLISFPKNISIENKTNEEKLTEYVKELEKMNEILNEKNKDNVMKLKELESLFRKNPNIYKLIEKESDPNKLLKLDEIFHPSLYETYFERVCLISELSNFNPKKNKIVKRYNFNIGESKRKNKILLSKINSSELNYQGIIKEMKTKTKFEDNKLIIDSSKCSFTLEKIIPIKIEIKEKFEKNKEIILIKSKFEINILSPPKKVKPLEKSHSDLTIINNIINNKNISNEYKIEKIKELNILKSILKKEKEVEENSQKINLLFNDDSSANDSNKKLSIDKMREIDLDESVGNISIREDRSNSIMINPTILFESKDYYCLYQEDYVRRKLGHLNDVCSERNIYSDQIYVLVEKKNLIKKYIMLSPNHFCIIDQNTLKFVYVDKIKNIKNIVISNKNLNMILFRFLDGEDLLIESLRAHDLISYMKINYFSNKDSIFRYEDKFIIKLKGQLHSLIVTDKILTNLPNFDGAIKVGYLSLYKAKFISSNFTDTIGVLTNIGLLLLEESSLRPILLIPILGSIIKKVEKERFGNNNCFEIIMASGITKVFSVRKSRERDTWMVQFSKMKKDYDEKMKLIGAIKKISTKKVVKFKEP